MSFGCYGKGAKRENELKAILQKNDFVVVRSAGSGSEVSPDIIAIKGGECFAIEVKSREAGLFVPDAEMSCLSLWESQGAVPVIAYRRNGQGWIFLNPKSLETRAKGQGLAPPTAYAKGNPNLTSAGRIS